MLKQIKALGLVLVIGGMLVGCEAPEEVKNIDLQGAVDNVEAFVDEKINKDKEIQEALLLMADDLLNEVDFVQAYMNDNKGMDINEYANYVANKGVEAAMAAMEQEGIAVNIEDVQVLVGQYMYEEVYNKLQQNEYKINQGMINNKFEELEKEQQELVPEAEPVDEQQWEEDMYNKLLQVANQEFGNCYINRDDLGNNGIEVYARIYADPEFIDDIGYLKIDAEGNIVYIEKF
jgi:hypothetical protein